MDAEAMERVMLQAKRAVADARAFRALVTGSPTSMDENALRMEERLEREHRRALNAAGIPEAG